MWLNFQLQHGLLIWGLQWDWALFADSYQLGSVLHSLEKQDLQCGFTATISLSLGQIVCATHFLSLVSKHFNMSLKRKEYKVNDSAEKAALFFTACQANPDTKVK
jgi:hypothetical protein